MDLEHGSKLLGCHGKRSGLHAVKSQEAYICRRRYWNISGAKQGFVFLFCSLVVPVLLGWCSVGGRTKRRFCGFGFSFAGMGSLGPVQFLNAPGSMSSNYS